MDIEWKSIRNVARGTAPAQEAHEVERWADRSPERRRLLEDSIRFYADVPCEDESLSEGDLDAAWRRIDPASQRIHDDRRAHARPYTRWIAAAVIGAAVLAGVRILTTNGGQQKLAADVEVEPVRITLPDGSVYTVKKNDLQEIVIPGFVVTGEGLLSQEDAAPTDADTPGARVEIKVPRGINYSITIADGTRVRLNAESSLRFPSLLTGPDRRVELRGEAWFEVARDEEKPFIVDAGGATVRVLGTNFNVKAYEPEVSSVALVSGSVEVDAGRERRILTPGQQCDIESGTLTVAEADLSVVLAWRNDEFAFKDAALRSITDELARWYNVEVVYEQAWLQDERFYVFVKRSRSLTEVMDRIARTERMSYRIEKGKLIISE